MKPATDVARGQVSTARMNLDVAMIVGALVVLAVAVPLAIVLNIWIDEGFTLHTTGAGVAQAWRQSVGFEMQPPLYFVLEAAWRDLDRGSIAFARMPSVLFAMLAVVALVGVGRRVAPRVPPLAVALVAALNPLVIWAAVEMRVYALVLAIGAGLLWAFIDGFVAEKPSRRAQIAYAALAVAGLYTQYYIGFALVAHGITLLILRRRAIVAYIITGAVVAVAFAPFLPIAFTQVRYSGDSIASLGWPALVKRLFEAIYVYVLPHQLWWSHAARLAGLVASAALAIGLLAAGRPRTDRLGAVVLLNWLCTLIVFGIVFRVTGTPIDVARHLLAVLPLSLLAVLVVVSGLTRFATALRPAAAVVYATFALTMLAVTYWPPTIKVGDWQHVSDVLDREDTDGTPIAVYPADLTLVLAPYAHLAAPPIPIPAPLTYTLDYEDRLMLHDPAQVARVLDPIRARTGRLWIVTPGPCSKERDNSAFGYYCENLDAYLDRRYRLVRSIPFRGAQLSLYDRRALPTEDTKRR